MKITFYLCSLFSLAFLCINSTILYSMEKEESKILPLRTQCLNYCKKDLTRYLPKLLSTKIPIDISFEVLNSLTKEQLTEYNDLLSEVVNNSDTSLEAGCFLVLTKCPQFNVPHLKLHERIKALIQNKEGIMPSALELVTRSFKPQDICSKPFSELMPQGIDTHPQAQLFIQRLFHTHHAKSESPFSLLPSSINNSISQEEAEKKSIYKALVQKKSPTRKLKIHDTANACVGEIEDTTIADDGESEFLATVSSDGKFAAIVTPLQGIRIYRIQNSQLIFNLHFPDLCRSIKFITHIAFDENVAHFHLTISNGRNTKHVEYLLPQAYLKQQLTLEQLMYLMILHYYLNGNKSYGIPFFEKSKRIASGRALIAAHKLKETMLLESFKDGDYSLALDKLEQLTLEGRKSQKSAFQYPFINEDKKLESAYKEIDEFVFALNSYFVTGTLKDLPQGLSSILSFRLQKKLCKAMLEVVKQLWSEKDLSEYTLVYTEDNYQEKVREYTQKVTELFLSLQGRVPQEKVQGHLCTLARNALKHYLAYQ